MKNIRIWFQKSDAAAYISHLDLVRCMTRAVRRAALPLWYTEGFNPHPYLTFPLPLPLGQSGLCEPMDLRILDESTPQTLLAKLAPVMPQGIAVIAVSEPQMDAKEIAAAQYDITLTFAGTEKVNSFTETAQILLAGNSLPAEKKSKKGIVTVNLCEMIRDFSIGSADRAAVLHCTLAAGNTTNLNAALLANTLLTAAGLDCELMEIARLWLLNADLAEFR